ncbi:MAG: tetratricopeptide repeat protein [Clostridium sp.]|nr:tetratricopeptide repeat protein [Clostridium sp.]
MKHTRYIIAAIAGIIASSAMTSCYDSNDHSTKAERKLIKEGNGLYADTLYTKALEKYSEAMLHSPSSEAARFNSAASLFHIGKGTQNDSTVSKSISEYEQIGKSASDSLIREKAYYNLGNIAFNDSNFAQSIECYKAALRINPSNPHTRQNLLVAMLKMPDNQQDQQQQQQNQDQQQNQEQQNQEQQQPEMSQNAEQLLQTMQNRENETRKNTKPAQSRPASLDKPW